MTEQLDKKFVRDLSARKNEPAWMRDLRLQALDAYHRLPLPSWGPDLSQLDIAQIVKYVAPQTNLVDNFV